MAHDNKLINLFILFVYIVVDIWGTRSLIIVVETLGIIQRYDVVYFKVVLVETFTAILIEIYSQRVKLTSDGSKRKGVSSEMDWMTY